MRSSAVSSSRSRPWRSRCSSHTTKAPSRPAPASSMNGTTEKPSGVISVPPIVSAPRGWISPHWPLCRIASTISPSPAADSSTPTTSSCGRRSDTGARAICPRTSRMTITTTVSPANT